MNPLGQQLCALACVARNATKGNVFSCNNSCIIGYVLPRGLGFSGAARAEFNAAINTAHIPCNNFPLQPVGYVPFVHCELLPSLQIYLNDGSADCCLSSPSASCSSQAHGRPTLVFGSIAPNPRIGSTETGYALKPSGLAYDFFRILRPPLPAPLSSFFPRIGLDKAVAHVSLLVGLA